MPNPDYVYNADDWGMTYEWRDLDLLTDNMCVGDIMEIGTLIEGPRKWAAVIRTPDGEGKLELFDTQESAEKAADNTSAVPGEMPR